MTQQPGNKGSAHVVVKCGSGKRYRLMTGMTAARLKNGAQHGQQSVTGAWIGSIRSITRSYARQAVEQEPTIHEGLYSAQNGNAKDGYQTAARSTEKPKALNEQYSRSLEVANGELYNATSERLRLI